MYHNKLECSAPLAVIGQGTNYDFLDGGVEVGVGAYDSEVLGPESEVGGQAVGVRVLADDCVSSLGLK